ncbi:ATP-binding protein [Gloeocapsopsis dulcis]|uniref:ATP-binding protein n=1 Tax=Gloeocapsopsis dulcis TaxID=2859516 RepID=UPI0018C75F8C|nr:ATP-binding protein [Gloeocapsopsis dulcis]WNN91435.1 ATP-binding protein [Gloeocapsopsis dulcis]
MVEVINIQSKQVIRVQVPRARRTQRPVYIKQNPLTGTYRRNYEGDYLCDEETVRRMLAEQVEDVRDARLLEGYSFEDLNLNTFNVYRNLFKATKPDHPWLELDDREFLRSIGGWGRDRQTGVEGLRLAGLLMFGKLRSILDAVPNYVVDYQESPRPKTEARWVDRLTTDGTWSGNLYDFYRRVIQKLFADLKVPFKLKGTERIDETPVHEALREALVNTLIHADYTGRVSILVVKRPDMFGFRNPGSMRLPLEEVKQGGISDCRNRNLQKMFQLVGLGEQAGSGIPRIYNNWKQQHWRLPELWEQLEPEQTLLSMKMVSLLPEETLKKLDDRFGSPFRELSNDQMLALVTVANEGKVTHARLKDMTTAHPRDLSQVLSSLVRDGFLESDGATRGTFYFFPGEPPCSDDNLVEHSYRLDIESSGKDLLSSSDHLPASSDHLPASSDHLSSLSALAAPVREKGKASKELMQEVILKLCRKQFLTQKELAELLDRSPNTLRTSYLNQMVSDGQLELKYPDKLTHPYQAYRTRRA